MAYSHVLIIHLLKRKFDMLLFLLDKCTIGLRKIWKPKPIDYYAKLYDIPIYEITEGPVENIDVYAPQFTPEKIDRINKLQEDILSSSKTFDQTLSTLSGAELTISIGIVSYIIDLSTSMYKEALIAAWMLIFISLIIKDNEKK